MKNDPIYDFKISSVMRLDEVFTKKQIDEGIEFEDVDYYFSHTGIAQQIKDYAERTDVELTIGDFKLKIRKKRSEKPI
jgi:hypothetical protein